MTHPHGAGALCSTVRDLVDWQRALMGGRVVNAQSYALMTTPDTLNNGRPLTYGFGLSAGKLGAHRSIGHIGRHQRLHDGERVLPDDSVNVVVFSNADAGPDALALTCRARCSASRSSRRRNRSSRWRFPSRLRDQLPGVYDLAVPAGGKFVIHITVENGQVMTQAEGPGQGKFPLMYAGNMGRSARRSIRRCASRSSVRTARSRRCGSCRAAGRWRGRGGRRPRAVVLDESE